MVIGIIIGLVIGVPIGFIISTLCAANTRCEDGDLYQ